MSIYYSFSSGTIRILVFIAIFIIFQWVAVGQKNKLIFYYDLVKYDSIVNYSQQNESVLDSRLTHLFNQGYIFSKLDSQSLKGNDNHVYINLGIKYTWLLDIFNKRPNLPIEEVLDSAQNNGYPFAYYLLDSAWLRNDSAFATGHFVSGPFVELDSVILPPGLKGRYSYYNILAGWKNPIPFSQKVINQIPERFDKIPYLKLIRPVDLSFQGKSAWAYLDIEEANKQLFEGILGVQRHLLEDKNVLIGVVNLQLEHVLGRGIDVYFNWRKFDLRSQALQLRIKRYFAFGSNYQLDFSADILNQDTSFLYTRVGVDWIKSFSGNSELGFAVKRQSATVLRKEMTQNLQNFTTYFIGVTGQYGCKIKELQKPNNGLGIGSTLLLGLKEIENSGFSTTVQLEANLTQQWKILRRSFFYNSFSTGIIQNDSIADNELFRIGGIQSLRGFNEQQFFASTYLASQNELRWYFDELQLSTQYDLAFLKTGTSPIYLFKQSFGFGLGIQSDSGIFRINFALPLEKTTSPNIQDARIHINLSSTF